MRYGSFENQLPTHKLFTNSTNLVKYVAVRPGIYY